MDTLSLTKFLIVNQWIALVGLKEFSIKINAEDINFKLKEIWSEINIYWTIIWKKKVKTKHLFKANFLETDSKGDILYEKAAKYDIGEGQKACITTMLTWNASENMDAVVWLCMLT